MPRPDSIILGRWLHGRIKTIHFLNCGLAWLLLCHQFSLLYYKLTFRIILRPILILIGCLFLIFLSLVLGFFIVSLKSTMFQLLEAYQQVQKVVLLGFLSRHIWLYQASRFYRLSFLHYCHGTIKLQQDFLVFGGRYFVLIISIFYCIMIGLFELLLNFIDLYTLGSLAKIFLRLYCFFGFLVFVRFVAFAALVTLFRERF